MNKKMQKENHFKVAFCTALIFVALQNYTATSQTLHVGLMRSFHLTSVSISLDQGSYNLYADSTLHKINSKSEKITLTSKVDQIELQLNDSVLGRFKCIYLREAEQYSSLNLTPVLPSGKKQRKYQDDFTITAEPEKRLKIINEVEMQNYLAGVIESEGGGGKHIEYYKVQAILSRTYALDHLSKHQKEGFSLCDDVHCQAYHSMLRFTPTIKTAVEATKGIVMLDEYFQLADGFFFANCGGQTSESDFVWNTSVSYCKSVRDTFCIHSKQATWQKRIPQYRWREYLVNHFGYPIQDSIIGSLIYTFNQPERAAFYIAPHLGIPLRDIREEFKLKSTWFSAYPDGTEVVLNGRGFGHGVGLCQEGAMKMANIGYDHNQILKFYFTGIELFDYHSWLFLNQRVEKIPGL